MLFITKFNNITPSNNPCHCNLGLQRKKKMNVDLESLAEATSGAIGSLISTTILYPLDTCKTKYQAEARSSGRIKYRFFFFFLIPTHHSQFPFYDWFSICSCSPCWRVIKIGFCVFLPELGVFGSRLCVMVLCWGDGDRWSTTCLIALPFSSICFVVSDTLLLILKDVIFLSWVYLNSSFLY